MSAKDLSLRKRQKKPVTKTTPDKDSQKEVSFTTLGIIKSAAEGVVHVIVLYERKGGGGGGGTASPWVQLNEVRYLALSQTTLGMISPVVMHTAILSRTRVPPVWKVETWVSVDTIDFFNQVVAPFGHDFCEAVSEYTTERTIFGQARLATNGDAGTKIAIPLKSCLVNKTSTIYLKDKQLGDECCFATTTLREACQILEHMAIQYQPTAETRKASWTPGSKPPPSRNAGASGVSSSSLPSPPSDLNTFTMYYPSLQGEVGFYRLDCVQSLHYIQSTTSFANVSKYLLPAIKGSSVRQMHEIMLLLLRDDSGDADRDSQEDRLTVDDIIGRDSLFDDISDFVAQEWQRKERHANIAAALTEFGALHLLIAIAMAAKAVKRICNNRRKQGFDYARVGLNTLIKTSGGHWHPETATPTASVDTRELIGHILGEGCFRRFPSKTRPHALCYVASESSEITEFTASASRVSLEDELRQPDGRLKEEWARFISELSDAHSVLIVDSSEAFTPRSRLEALHQNSKRNIVLRRNEIPTPGTEAFNLLSIHFCNVFVADVHMYSTHEWTLLMKAISLLYNRYTEEAKALDHLGDLEPPVCKRSVLGCASIQPCGPATPVIRDLLYVDSDHLPELGDISPSLFSWMSESGGFIENARFIFDTDKNYDVSDQTPMLKPSHEKLDNGSTSVSALVTLVRDPGPRVPEFIQFDEANRLCRDEWNTLIWLMALHLPQMKLIVSIPLAANKGVEAELTPMDAVRFYMTKAYPTEYWSSSD
jgi:hypothetical protein